MKLLNSMSQHSEKFCNKTKRNSRKCHPKKNFNTKTFELNFRELRMRRAQKNGCVISNERRHKTFKPSKQPNSSDRDNFHSKNSPSPRSPNSGTKTSTRACSQKNFSFVTCDVK